MRSGIESRFIFKPCQKVLKFYSVCGVFNINIKGMFIKYLCLELSGEVGELFMHSTALNVFHTMGSRLGASDIGESDEYSAVKELVSE